MPVSDIIEIKYCSKSEIEKLQQFFDSHWREGHILAQDRALLKWQFADRRAEPDDNTRGPTVLLASSNDQIVAILGLILCDFNVRGRIVSAVWLSHWLSIPKVRTQGIGLGLIKKVQDFGFAAILGLGINERVRRLYTAMRFEILSSTLRWLGVCDLDKTVHLLKAVAPQVDLETLFRYSVQYAIKPQAQFTDAVKISEWDRAMAGDWDQAWVSCFAPELICTNRDSSYLGWRYIDHPTFVYDMRVARHAGTQEILGLAVFRIEEIREHEEKILRIVEFVSLPAAELPLANAIVKAAKDYGVAFADFYCTSKKMKSGLQVLGFKVYQPQGQLVDFPSLFQPLEPGGTPLQGVLQLAKPLQDELGKLSNSDEFYVTRSDGDQDRPN